MRDHRAWSDSERSHLNEFLFLREMGRDLPIAGPPPVVDLNSLVSRCDAWKIYLAHVAHCLWVEAGRRVPWSIVGATAEHLTQLLDSQSMFTFNAARGRYEFFAPAADWSPAISFEFLSSSSMIGPTHWETIQRVVEWVRHNLVHIGSYRSAGFASQEEQFEAYFGYRGWPPVDRMIAPPPPGVAYRYSYLCWGTDGFMKALLRAVNIPQRRGYSDFGYGPGHSRSEFFTVGRALSHGDDPYNGWVYLGINTPPISRLFYTDAQLNSLIVAPVARPGLTVTETAGYNHRYWLIAIAVEYRTDYLLRKRCLDRASGRVGTATRLWEDLHEYYDDAEIERIAADLDAELRSIPGGCDSVGFEWLR